MAASFLAKKHVWVGSSFSMDSEVPMLRVMMRGGLLEEGDFKKRRDAWYARATATESSPRSIPLWTLAFADNLQTRAEATAAMAALPEGVAWSSALRLDQESYARAQVGHALLLAGQVQAGLGQLEGATLACDWLRWPVHQTQALLHLGQAHATLGHRESACTAYQRVVDRWGTAATSATRDAARARLKVLGCGTPAAGAP